MKFTDKIKNLFISSKQTETVEKGYDNNITYNSDSIYLGEGLWGKELTSGIINYNKLASNYRNLAYRCINTRAEAVAKSHPVVMRLKNQTDKYEPSVHPLLEIFRKPNNKMQSYYHILYSTIKDLDLFGNCFWYIARDNFGEPAEIHLLPTRQIKIKLLADGSIEYVYNANLASQITYSQDEIIHFKYPNVDNNNLYGLGIVEAGNIIFEIENAINSYQRRWFDNDGSPRFALTTDLKLTPVEFNKYVELLKNSHAGTNNAGKTMVLPGGFKPVSVSSTPKESDYIQTWKVIETRILSMFGVPPSLLSIVDNANRASSLEARPTFNENTIEPLLKNIDETFTVFMRDAYDDMTIKIVHRTEVPSTYREQELKELQVGLQNGAVSKNEFRNWLNLDPIEAGDEGFNVLENQN